MAEAFGDHAAGGGSGVEPGMYDAIVSSARIVREKDGKIKINDSGKKLCDVEFKISEDATVRRRFSISFGQNTSNGQWSAFAKLIEALTGIKAGTPEQRQVTDEELYGKRCRIVVETNDRGYSDVSNVMPAARAAAQAQRPMAVAGRTSSRAPEREPERPPIDESYDPGWDGSDDVPF